MSIGSFAKTAPVSLLVLVSLASCEFQKQADSKFGDQHFKTAIALIELHHTRYGTYPDSLKDLKYLGIGMASQFHQSNTSGLGTSPSNVGGAPQVTPGT